MLSFDALVERAVVFACEFSLFVVFGRYGKEVCDAIAAKCLTGRPKTVQKAQEAFLLWVELEAVDAFLVCPYSTFLRLCKVYVDW